MREDELAVYVSMRRAETTGNYMTRSYPKDLQIRIDPAAFQVFVNNYWDTYRRRYKSAFEKRDTFWISYEQLIQEESFKVDILPLLWRFLGVDDSQPLKKLRETIKQAAPEEDLSKVISNYEELEFCFRHTQVKHFRDTATSNKVTDKMSDKCSSASEKSNRTIMSWSILLPICSRDRLSKRIPLSDSAREQLAEKFNKNRLAEVTIMSQHQSGTSLDDERLLEVP